MATVDFRIKGVAKTAGVKVRFRHGDKFSFELSTGLKVNRNHWSKKQQRVTQNIDANYRVKVNKSLNKLEAFIMNEYYDSVATNVEVDQMWLRSKVNECLYKTVIFNDESNEYFIPFIEKFIERAKKARNKKTGNPLSELTINSYFTTLSKIIAFEQKYKLKLRISDINLNFHSKFHKFLSEEQLLNPNTIGGYFSKIKLFCNNAEISGLVVSIELKSKNFYTPQNSTKDIYLNPKEIDLIYNHLFESKRLENARDWFVIGLWTGLRVSDLLELTRKNVKEGFIHKITFKTKTPVIIPMHPQVHEIILKNCRNFPHKISEQKFNKYIKEVCKEVGLIELTEGYKMVAIEQGDKEINRKKHGLYPKYELVSTHICRRSFATNLYGKIDTMTIMQITGHKSEGQFLEYIKTTSIEYAEKLKNIPLFQPKR